MSNETHYLVISGSEEQTTLEDFKGFYRDENEARAFTEKCDESLVRVLKFNPDAGAYQRVYEKHNTSDDD